MGSITNQGDAPATRLLRSNAPQLPQVLTPQKLFSTIRKEILEATEHKELVYEDIPEETGTLVVDSLDQDPDIENSCPRVGYNSLTRTIDITIMPTFVHDASHSWFTRELFSMYRSGFLTETEQDSISFFSNPTFKGFQPPYAASRKEPDHALLPDDQEFPSLVFESAWSESMPRLHRDKDLWLQGGRPDTQLVFLVKWSKSVHGVVRGIVEVHGRNSAGAPQLLQVESIFPAPANPASQTIPITLGQVMGRNLPGGRNSTDVHHLSLDTFRSAAGKLVEREGFTHA
ncbi:hypothetical protein MGYG_04839 [Nannizzia gypsea CBS 118893]|uniref:Uncharacterized protein n=1 Tax=Arthroderma gypseum (strain ATCC MYA-4604 / CBS 118893) TaxID=535722 RepID=E4UX40_ARTGP|nr:hypothetical protein MGYG_04839 [Nannizzia gypsea CBS 118893]EFR01840.1 hypothetical protein MGYG_04839 [Nannizzia gypsea CBS 118893]